MARTIRRRQKKDDEPRGIKQLPYTFETIPIKMTHYKLSMDLIHASYTGEQTLLKETLFKFMCYISEDTNLKVGFGRYGSDNLAGNTYVSEMHDTRYTVTSIDALFESGNHQSLYTIDISASSISRASTKRACITIHLTFAGSHDAFANNERIADFVITKAYLSLSQPPWVSSMRYDPDVR